MSFTNKNSAVKPGKFRGKLAIGLVVAALTATVGTATLGAVHAISPGDMPSTKAECKDDGWMHFKKDDGSMVFKNQGECVSNFEHEHEGHGQGNHGYGGQNGYGGNNGNDIQANVNVNLNNSSNNIINVIVRLIFGA